MLTLLSSRLGISLSLCEFNYIMVCLLFFKLYISAVKCFDLTFIFNERKYCVTTCPNDGTVGVESAIISNKSY